MLGPRHLADDGGAVIGTAAAERCDAPCGADALKAGNDRHLAFLKALDAAELAPDTPRPEDTAAFAAVSLEDFVSFLEGTPYAAALAVALTTRTGIAMRRTPPCSSERQTPTRGPFSDSTVLRLLDAIAA